MSYTKKNWQDLPNTTTPITAIELNRMENGIADANGAIGADAYDSTATYAVNDLCIYNNTLYICTTAISTAEAWNSSHWKAISVDDMLISKTESNNVVTELNKKIHMSNIKEEIVSDSGTSTTTSSRAFITACSVNLTAGKWLILGASESNIGNNSFPIITKFDYSGDIQLIGGRNTYRGTMNAGGGLTSWSIVNVSTTGTINLQNYVDSSYSIRSNMSAIRLS